MRTITLLAGFAFALLLVYREAFAWGAVVYMSSYPAYALVSYVERRHRLEKERQEREWRDGGWFERARGE